MRSVLVYAGILILSLGVAWVRWTAEPDKIGEDEVLIAQGSADQIAQISYVSEKMEVLINVKKDSNGSYLWTTYTDKKNPEDPQRKEFKAGNNGNKLLESLSPFIGIRKLDVEESKLEELGLSNSQASLSIKRGENVRVFDIGAEAYGTKDYYIRDQKSSEIFLVDDRKLTPLLKARTNLPDRALWSQKPPQAVSAVVYLGDRKLLLEHSNWQDKSNAKWVQTGASDEDNTQLETWLGKFFRLSSSRYQSSNDQLEALTKQFAVQLNWEDGQSQTLEIFQQGKEWWAQSEHTRTKVKVTGNTLSALYEDLPGLVKD